jgi:nitrite reductase/ring-hydroxylating ferredoxin subunit
VNAHERMTGAPPISRRTAIMQAGLAAAALAGLSGCTNYGASETPSSAPSSAAGPLSATTADIPVGGGKIFADAQAVITQPTAGQFKAFTSICTHQQCPVAEVTDTINCKCHGSKFSITDGSVVNPPAPSPLAAKTVTVSGDEISVA